MLKIYRTLIISFAIIFLNFIPCEGKNIVNYNDLIENGKALDNKQVTIEGEAIGEPLSRGDHTWVNISDGNIGFGIWIENNLMDKIAVYGDHKNKGDYLKITGKFHRACKEHGGDMDIHSTKVEVVKDGYELKEKINFNRLAIGGAFFIAIFIVVLLDIKNSKK